jgi:hypothetical protein
LLMHIPIWPPDGAMFALCAVAWGFVQVTSGLALAVHWSASREPGIGDHPSALADKPMPRQQSDHQSDRIANAAGRVPTPLDDDGCFHVLRKLAGQPGIKIGRGVHVGRDREIIGSRRDLAVLLGNRRPPFTDSCIGLPSRGACLCKRTAASPASSWPSLASTDCPVGACSQNAHVSRQGVEETEMNRP